MLDSVEAYTLTQSVFASPSQNASTWKTATSGMVVEPVARAALGGRRGGILWLLNAEGALGDVEAQRAPEMAEHSNVSDMFVQSSVW